MTELTQRSSGSSDVSLAARLKDLDNSPVDIDTSLSRELLRDAVGDMDAELDDCAVTLKAHLAKHSTTVQCDGELKGVLTLPCHRCLGPAKVPLAVPVHTIFVPPAKIPVEDTTADPEADDLDFAHHDGEIVDLAPIMREYIILAVPLRILCKDDCLGLCPQCGTDRNVAGCGCSPVPSIGPFAALKNVKL